MPLFWVQDSEILEILQNLDAWDSKNLGMHGKDSGIKWEWIPVDPKLGKY